MFCVPRLGQNVQCIKNLKYLHNSTKFYNVFIFVFGVILEKMIISEGESATFGVFLLQFNFKF